MSDPATWTTEQWAELEADLTDLERTNPEVAEARRRYDEAMYGRCVACHDVSLRQDGWCSEHRPRGAA